MNTQNLENQNPEEIRQLAKLLAAAMAKQGALTAKQGAQVVGQGVMATAGKILVDTAKEVRTDLRTDPKRFRIGVQRLVVACLLTGGVGLFVGVAIGLGDPAHLANQPTQIEAPGVARDVNALEASDGN
jgi:hypothetical protein